MPSGIALSLRRHHEPMKLVHVVPRFDSEASGLSHSVPQLCKALAESGHCVELFCVAAGRPIPGVTVNVYRHWFGSARLGISPSLAWSLRSHAKGVDIVHNHSLWAFVNVASGWAVANKGAKLVTSPRGTLSAWALSRRRWVKKLLWPLQKQALSQADLLHATSENEYLDIRKAGFRAPVVIAPNGVEIPQEKPAEAHKCNTRTLLFLGRLHPTKCIDKLIQAWHKVENSFPSWQLVIAGVGSPWYESHLKSLVSSLGLLRVNFIGPVYGEEKSRTYWNADLFILPSHSENFGLVVAEALAHGCPTIVSTGAPWAALVDRDCGWWVDNDIETLSTTMRTAMSRPREQLEKMGSNGRRWVTFAFSWENIAREMEAAYRWTMAGGSKPENVHLD